jgi:hypothetical protein
MMAVLTCGMTKEVSPVYALFALYHSLIYLTSFSIETNRNAYLQSVGGSGFTTSNTVLFSQISGTGGPGQLPFKVQILIPKTLFGKAGGLNLNVQCAARSNQQGIDEIDIYGDVDWYSWINVKGTPQRA